MQPASTYSNDNEKRKLKFLSTSIRSRAVCTCVEYDAIATSLYPRALVRTFFIGISFFFFCIFLLTKYLICSAVPLLVALVIDQAASFRVLNSSFFNMWINTGNICASMTAWICWRFPAVIFDIVHDASFRIDSFSDDSKCRMWGNAPLFKITWVWTSSPVTMFPTARSAALTMLCESCLASKKQCGNRRFYYQK